MSPRGSNATWAWRRGATCRSCPGRSTTVPSSERRPSRSARGDVRIGPLGHRRPAPTAPAHGRRLGHRLRRAERAARTVTVKLRFGDFTQVTRSTRSTARSTRRRHRAVATPARERRLARGVRLLGVSLSGLVDPGEGTSSAGLDTPPTGAGRSAPRGSGATAACRPDPARPDASRRRALSSPGVGHSRSTPSGPYAEGVGRRPCHTGRIRCAAGRGPMGPSDRTSPPGRPRRDAPDGA